MGHGPPRTAHPWTADPAHAPLLPWLRYIAPPHPPCSAAPVLKVPASACQYRTWPAATPCTGRTTVQGVTNHPNLSTHMPILSRGAPLLAHPNSYAETFPAALLTAQAPNITNQGTAPELSATPHGCSLTPLGFPPATSAALVPRRLPPAPSWPPPPPSWLPPPPPPAPWP